jgi:hypothetical protein
MGKSKASPHKSKRSKAKDQVTLPAVSFDYMFPDGKSPALVYRDRLSRKIFSRVVTHKGSRDPWIISKSIEDLDSLGHGGVVIKSE